MVAWRYFVCYLVYCLSNVIYKITYTIFKRWNEIKTKHTTNPKDNKDFQKNSFNDFYSAYNTTPQEQLENSKNHRQTRPRDNANKENTELKKSGSPEQELNSMIEWSQVWLQDDPPTRPNQAYFMPGAELF